MNDKVSKTGVKLKTADTIKTNQFRFLLFGGSLQKTSANAASINN
jgi:hypothetical protein